MIPLPATLIAAAIIGIGALPMPYGYYNLVRIVATGMFIWSAVVLYQRGGQYLPWIFALVAITFNPIFKISFEKEVWIVIDIVAAVLLFIFARPLASNNASESRKGP